MRLLLPMLALFVPFVSATADLGFEGDLLRSCPYKGAEYGRFQDGLARAARAAGLLDDGQSIRFARAPRDSFASLVTISADCALDPAGRPKEAKILVAKGNPSEFDHSYLTAVYVHLHELGHSLGEDVDFVEKAKSSEGAADWYAARNFWKVLDASPDAVAGYARRIEAISPGLRDAPLCRGKGIDRDRCLLSLFVAFEPTSSSIDGSSLRDSPSAWDRSRVFATELPRTYPNYLPIRPGHPALECRIQTALRGMLCDSLEAGNCARPDCSRNPAR